MFHKIINPERNVPEGAFKIHGFSTDFLKSKEIFEKIADDLLEFIRDKKIIIHNASFDLGFLNHELRLIKKNEIKRDNIIDSLEIARGKYPGARNSLDALCKRFLVDNSNRKLHGALLDSELLAEVYLELIGGKEPDLALAVEKKAINQSNEEVNGKKVLRSFIKWIFIKTS